MKPNTEHSTTLMKKIFGKMNISNFPVVCIEDYSGLTIGKTYNVVSVEVILDWDLVEDGYIIINDLNVECQVCASKFIPLEQWREQQINKLL